MLETIFELIQDPTNFCNWVDLVELILSFVALGVGIVAILCCPEFALLGVIACIIGVGGIIFGHW